MRPKDVLLALDNKQGVPELSIVTVHLLRTLPPASKCGMQNSHKLTLTTQASALIANTGPLLYDSHNAGADCNTLTCKIQKWLWCWLLLQARCYSEFRQWICMMRIHNLCAAALCIKLF